MAWNDSKVTNSGATAAGKITSTEWNNMVTYIESVISSSGTLASGVVATGSIDMNGNELILDADADTSITADTDDQIDFRVGGSDQGSWTTTGLGIGTTSPTALVTVGGSIFTTVFFDSASEEGLIVAPNQDNGRLFVQGNAQASIYLADAGASTDDKVLRINNNGGVTTFDSVNDANSAFIAQNILTLDHGAGHVGIGTTTIETNAALTISDSIPQISLRDSSDASVWEVGQNSNQFYINQQGDSDASTFTIDSSNNVGIGTSSPDGVLDVRGADPVVFIRSSSVNEQIYLRLGEDDDSFQGGGIHYDGSSDILNLIVHDSIDTNTASDYNAIQIDRNSSYIYHRSKGQIAFFADTNSNNTGTDVGIDFQTQGSSKMALTYEGNVGIGTSSPSAKLHVVQNSTNEGVIIDMNAVQNALEINMAADADAVYINSTSTSQSILKLYTDAVHTGSGNNSLFHIEQDNSSASGTCFTIQNDGTGDGLFVDQNGNGIALDIDSEATSGANFAVRVVTGQGARVAQFAQNTSNDYVQFGNVGTDSVGSHWFYRDLGSASTAGPVVSIEQDNSGDDQPALTIQQDGSGIALDVNYTNATTKNVIYARSPSGSANDFGARWLDDISRYGILLGDGTNAYRLWVDSTGDLRIHTADPSSDTDGTVVGTQS